MRTSPPREAASLPSFHARHKMELLARDERLARALGRDAAAGNVETYTARFAEAMRREPTPGGHANALSHLVGHVRERGAAQRLAALVERYRRGEASRAQVAATLRAALVAEGAAWAASQSYFDAFQSSSSDASGARP